jgi:enoyl-CoA hydratase/carnithine racemase
MSVVIDTHSERSVGWIRLNSPESANALGKQDMSRLAARISELGSEKTVRALVITGEGASFSAGAVLGDLNGEDKDDVTALMVAQMSAIHSALANVLLLPLWR